MSIHIPVISRFNAAGAAMPLASRIMLFSSLGLWATVEASALSEIQEQTVPETSEQVERLPLPSGNAGPSGGSQNAAPSDADQSDSPGTTFDKNMERGDGEQTGKQAGRVDIDPNGPIPQPIYDLGKLPEPVRRMRNLIVEAAKSGDIEALRPLITKGADGTLLSFGGIEGDPIEFLKESYSESDGQELLAILEEVLSAGYVHLDAGKPEEIYVWPYFAAIPLERLAPRQRVELFKILTAYDYEEMKTAGTYTFYRSGISPEGRWEFFVAGD